MNRLIIIGNGFDIAHGLKTKYSDFLSAYWTNVNLEYNDKLVSFSCMGEREIFNSYQDLVTMTKNKNIYQNNYAVLTVHNDFFLELNQDCTVTKWVDIEMFYYNKLKKLFHQKQFSKIQDLNNQFEDVKAAFENYIAREVNSANNLNDHYLTEISNLFKPLHDGTRYIPDFVDKLTYKVLNIVNDEIPLISNVHVLSFNYTGTVEIYKQTLDLNDDWEINHIHGFAEDGSNKIVFGFGDERDDLFKELENQNVNEYLRFMKSSAYLKTDNYYRFLNFIESGEFVVDIYGHSCGLSDRTLLNTIFENDNCLQIFLSFYKNTSTNEDNFHDLALNISRHFDDKIMMRRKVANKYFSIELPQRKFSE